MSLQALDLKTGSAKVTIGVRPEDVLVGSGQDKALVRIVEPTGHESIVTLNAGGIAFTARVPGDRRLTAGETVPFELRRDKIHVFDQATGKRLNAHG